MLSHHQPLWTLKLGATLAMQHVFCTRVPNLH